MLRIMLVAIPALPYALATVTHVPYASGADMVNMTLGAPGNIALATALRPSLRYSPLRPRPTTGGLSLPGATSASLLSDPQVTPPQYALLQPAVAEVRTFRQPSFPGTFSEPPMSAPPLTFVAGNEPPVKKKNYNTPTYPIKMGKNIPYDVPLDFSAPPAPSSVPAPAPGSQGSDSAKPAKPAVLLAQNAPNGISSLTAFYAVAALLATGSVSHRYCRTRPRQSTAAPLLSA